MKRIVIAAMAALSVSACGPSQTATDKILDVAYSWKDQGFEVGKAEQCMNWTRQVLVAACGDKFKDMQTLEPWDKAFLGENDMLRPEHADSLAGDMFGNKIETLEQVQKGDLVFLKNTYGNWNPGVITHVGIATGDGQYIHRMTSNEGIVKVQDIPAHEFASALRMDSSLCE
ncbi:NlpC/P60 family protein [Paraferrimonas sp. SM1919]|uniref:NlpC/P60 family protein n=1 Tax=Paraferrimonas sp. SM1919 TaxID=2662263 RepID=UPI0013CF5D81|nr:NlpC/P60 family protein [Paraferrimonas sp. SM1919]